MKFPVIKRLLSFRQAFIIGVLMLCVAIESANAQNEATDSVNVRGVATESVTQNCDPVHRCPLLFTCVNGLCMPRYRPCTCRRPVPPGCGAFCGTRTEKNEGNGPFLVNILTNAASALTTISFSLQQAGKITLKIMDPNGVLLKTLVDEVFEEGEHSIEWGTAEINEGVYILQIQSATSSQMEKLIVTK
jgi:hypothetical protein